MLLTILKSFPFAIRGIGLVVKGERNAKVHLLATCVILIAGIFFEISISDWYWLAMAVSIVWITESINTAIEKLVDLVSPEYHIIAGNIKDIAAGAVLIASIFALVIGILIFIP